MHECRAAESRAHNAGRLADRLYAASPDEAVRVAAASGTDRDVHEYVAVAAGDTADGLIDALRCAATNVPDVALVDLERDRRAGPGGVVLVFAGQGTAYWPVPDSVLDAAPVAETLNAAQQALHEIDPASTVNLRDVLASPAGDPTPDDPAAGQVAFAVLQIALTALWRSWGVTPAAVVGHSLGEVAAAHASGALDLRQAVEVALRRGQVVAPRIGSGAMCVVGLTREECAAEIDAAALHDVWIAGVNGPATCILSGSHEGIDTMLAALEPRSVFIRRIISTSSYPSHSPMMAEAAGELRQLLAGIEPTTATVPLHSTVTATKFEGPELNADHWAANLASPVRFADVVEQLVGEGASLFVEVAASPGLVPAVRDTLDALGRRGRVVPTLRKEPRGRPGAMLAAGELLAAGVPIDWAAVNGTERTHVDLPLEKWATQRFPLHRSGRADSHADAGVLAEHFTPANHPGEHQWVGRVDLESRSHLRDHRVAGSLPAPGAMWVEALTRAGRKACAADEIVLQDVRLNEPVMVAERENRANISVAATRVGTEVHLTVHHRGAQDEADAWRAAVTAQARAGTLTTRPDSLLEARADCRATLDAASMYARLEDVGIDYGHAFRGVEEAWSGEGQALVRLRRLLDLVQDTDEHVIHPVLLDSALHAVAAALSESGCARSLVPTGFGAVHLRAAEPTWAWATLRSAPDGDVVVAHVELFDENGAVVGVLDDATFAPLDAEVPLQDALHVYAWGEPTPPPTRATLRGTWVHIGAGVMQEDALVDRLRDTGATVRSVDVTAGTPRDTIREALAASPIAGVLLTVGLDGQDTDDPLTESSRWTGALLDVAQQAVRTGAALGRLLVVTRGVHGPGGHSGSVAAGAVWGLGRVIRAELPDLDPMLLDLGDTDDAAASHSVALLAATETVPGTEFLLTAEGPRVGRLAPLRATELQAWPRVPRHGGEHENATLLAERPGLLDSLCMTRSSRRAPAPDEVEITVESAGLNFNDVLKAMNICPGVEPGVNRLGAECAGIVTRVGAHVHDLRPGDRVMAVAAHAFSEYVTTPHTHVAPLPPQTDPISAGGVPVVFLTAVYGLEHLARLRAGETVLIHSATGGIGAAALQVARRRGARVIVSAGTPHKRALLEEAGLGPVLDSRSLDFIDRVKNMTGGRGVDVVVNFLTGDALVGGLSLLARGGRFVELGKQDVYADRSVGLGLLRHNRSLLVVDLEQVIEDDPQLLRELFTQVTDGLADGSFTPAPVERFTFDEATTAFDRMARAEHLGKVVLVPGDRSGPLAIRTDAPPLAGARLVTGGLGALGLVTAEALAAQGARHLVLAGRSAPTPEAQARIETLRSHGVRVDVVRFDVAQAAALDAWHTTLDQPLVGIYHAAGVLADATVENLDAESMRRVALPKTAGAWNLHRVSLGEPVTEFVLYSSAAGLLGSPGQGNYAAANATLDALAQYRVARGLPAVSINWGPWTTAGLATGDRGGVDALAQVGVLGIDPADGGHLLRHLGRSAVAQVCVLPLDRERLQDQATPGTLPALLTDVVDTIPDRGRAGEGHVETWQTVPLGRPRRHAVETYLCEQIALVLRQDLEQVDPGRSLSGMGFDSLMSLELRRRLKRSLGIDLPATAAWSHPDVASLADLVAGLLDLPLDPPRQLARQGTGSTTPPGAPMTPAPDNLSTDDDLDDLSEEEIAELLLSTIDEEARR